MILIHSENLIRSYVKLLGMIQNGKLPPHGQHFVPGVNAQEVGVPCWVAHPEDVQPYEGCTS